PSRAAKKSAHRVRPNAATANAARVHAAVASRDWDPLPALCADEIEVVDHTTGVVYDRTGYLATFRVFLKAEHPSFAPATLATLGDSLALYRESTSASGFVGRTFDVGAYEKEEIALIEVDAQGRHRRRDLFATGRLGDAVARLYERYTELLPDGPARTRAAATARSVAAYVGPVDPDRYAAAFAPDLEAVDHRTLGTFAARGKEAFLQHYRAWLDLADDTAFREDAILSLQSDAFLVRRTFLGTDRAGGGAFERQFIQLWNFGNDGLITRLEYFDADRDGEALARFDELTVEPPTARFAATPSRVAKKRERRVRANAATAAGSRIEAATAARDADALPTILAEHLEVVDHTTGATFDRQGWLATWRSGLRGQNLTYRQEPLATLGDSLALWRSSTSASRFVGRKFDVGAYESESIVLAEADAQGRLGRQEIFATDRLGDAVARIYERYADLLPDGPARTRAAATARSVAPFLEPLQIDSISAILAPGVEFIDHRTLGLGSARGAEAFLRGLRSLHEVADNTATRVDDVLGLRFDAFLVRRMGSGTVRASGGAYERHFLVLFVFGADGRLARVEEFDADRDDEALARFCELTGEPPPARSAVTPARAARRRERVRPNAATANAARLDAAIAARDADALPTLVADHAEVVDHTTGATYDGLGSLAFWRSLLRVQDLTYRSDPLATLGDSIALFRTSLFAGGVARGNFDVGAYETEVIGLIEVDAQGRRARTEVFAVDRLGDAVARSYERYADLLPDGPARARAAATARSFSGIAAFEWAAAVAPAI
ncbi:MAG: nuclear transport factor 2 family protein, partial [Actinobacteria bacterium]